MTDKYGKIHTDGSRSGGQPLADSIETKELALLNEMRREYPNASDYTVSRIALCRAIEQHEAFKQEVSDAVEYALATPDAVDLHHFIIPKPDPLAYAMIEVGLIPFANQLRAALDALGFEIREKGQ